MYISTCKLMRPCTYGGPRFKYPLSTQEVELRTAPIAIGPLSFVANFTLELLHAGLMLLYSAKNTFDVSWVEDQACHPTGFITLLKSLF